MKKGLMAGLVVLMVVLLGSQCLAAARPDSEKALDRICKKLGLTEGQKAQFKARQEKIRPAMKVERIEMKTLAEQMKAEIKKENPDRKKIHKYIRQINHLRMLAEIRRTDLLLDLRQILTPEQNEKFKQMMKRKKRKEKH